MFLDERFVGESDASTAVARAEVERRIRERSQLQAGKRKDSGGGGGEARLDCRVEIRQNLNCGPIRRYGTPIKAETTNTL